MRRLAVLGIIHLVLPTAACAVRRDAPADTVRVTDTLVVTDTVVRVDTVYRFDTLTALGGDSAGTAPGRADAGRALAVSANDVEALRRRRLVVPVAGVSPDQLPNTFAERRGSRLHGALDIPAPRGTPVVSADAGRVLKLHTSAGGGITAYVGDESGRFIYYYAHLDRYRPGLAEGQVLHKGEVLGYVGTTGNAPPNVPHLHFAIARSDDPERWWDGTPIDPRPIYLGAR